MLKIFSFIYMVALESLTALQRVNRNWFIYPPFSFFHSHFASFFLFLTETWNNWVVLFHVWANYLIQSLKIQRSVVICDHGKQKAWGPCSPFETVLVLKCGREAKQLESTMWLPNQKMLKWKAVGIENQMPFIHQPTLSQVPSWKP